MRARSIASRKSLSASPTSCRSGKPAYSKKAVLAGRPSVLLSLGSHLHHFGFLLFGHLFHALDLFVGQLLDLVEGALLFVLGDLLVLGRLFDQLIAVAPNIAHRGAVILKDAVQMLHHLASPFLGHRWHGDADDLAIVIGIEAEV